jgi:ureidoacrylate peracid hydrolase
MELGKDKTALIVVDMQNGFLSPEGAMAKLGFDVDRLMAAIPGCERLVAAARASDVPVIFTQYVYQADYKDAGVVVDEIFPAIRDVKLCAEGSWDAEIVDSLKPAANDPIVKKNRPSAFYSTNLESFLRAMKIDNLVICGVTTNICVETTARDASQRDYRTFVVSDATAEVEQDRYDVALKSLGYLFARVLTVNEVFDSWGVELSNVA